MTLRLILGHMFTAASVFAFGLGTIIGSFLNVCVWRLPRDESLLAPGSHCPKCGTPIRAWQNVPLLSWLLLRGRCWTCRQPISVRYPLVELLTGVVFLLLWLRVWRTGMPLSVLPGYLFLGGALIAVALIDLDHLIIPNLITYTGIAVGIALAVLLPEARVAAEAQPRVGGLPFAGWCVGEWLAMGLPAGVRHRAVSAGLDACGGAAAGFLMVWSVRELGRLLWGRERGHAATPVAARFSVRTVRVPGDSEDADWDDVLPRAGDRFVAAARLVTLRGTTGERTLVAAAGETLRLTVSRHGIAVAGERIPWTQTTGVEAHVLRWCLPRDVMGAGDVKLMAMVGAFLGAVPALFVILFGALSGLLVGLARVAVRPESRHAPIPFGPFLGFGALLWILAGTELVHGYGLFLMRLTQVARLGS